MTTARSIISTALETINVLADSQAVDADASAFGLARLNDLLDAWAIESLYAFQTIDYVGTATTSPVTIGPTGDVVTPYVPRRIESGYVRNGGLDHRFEIIDFQAYSDILLKAVTSPWPSAGYYDANGLLYLFPIPSSAELHVGVLERMAEFATLDTDYTFKPGVRRALHLTLAEELGPVFDRDLSPGLLSLAASARRKLKRSNHRVPQMGTRSADKFNLYPPGFSGGSASGGSAFDGVDGGNP